MIVPTGPSPLWNVPYQRNPFFTGREDALSSLHQSLQTNNAVALSHPRGISGLGGIGKTQLALEYAYRYGAEYQAVLWVQADTIAALSSSLVELAHVLKLPERYEQDQEIIIQAVLLWFRLHKNWLLIYDNVEDFSLVDPFLPKVAPGRLLFTTRTHNFGGFAQRLETSIMEPDVGALLLLRRAALLSPNALLDAAIPEDRNIARAISQELDGLPLAIDQAGAYIKEVSCSLLGYLARYQTRHSDLLRIRGGLNQNYPASVATTWSLSFEKVSQANPAAAELLNFCAFLAPDAIPEEILTTGASHLGDLLASVVTHPMQLDQVCKELLRYSLLQRETNGRTLTVHRLVQAVLQGNLSFEARTQWEQRAVLAVNAASPDVLDVEQWDACELWLPHVLVCATWIKQEHMTFPETMHLLDQAGFYLNKRARYSEAEPLVRLAVWISEQQLGAQHPDTARSLNNLAALYNSQGKYVQAEPLLVRALAIREQQLGAQHPDTARSLNNLALFYQNQEKYAQAEPLLVRALAIREQQLGAEHPDTALSLNNLAALYESQGKYAQTEPLLVRALAIREQQLGAEHPATATSLNNLAALYESQGKYAQAEPLYVRALAIREQQLGAEHPDTAHSLGNLALLYQKQGKDTQTEPLLVHALAIREQQLGAEHPDTAQILTNLAALYQSQEKYAQAEPLYVRALAIYEQQLGFFAYPPETVHSASLRHLLHAPSIGWVIH